MLSNTLSVLRDRVRLKAHSEYRQEAPPVLWQEFDREDLSWTKRNARLLVRMLEAERVVIEPAERIVFTRTVPSVPLVYSPVEWGEKFAAGSAHELGPISNICADWGMALSQGLLGRRQQAQESLRIHGDDPESGEFLETAVECINAILAFAERYAVEAEACGRSDISECLRWVPANPPRTFREALQALRLLHGAVWLSGHYHVGLGRFDQYMLPYLRADLQSGRLDISAAEDLLGEFFISLNKDSDLYPGVQQGDNGQSLMLGGVTRSGECAVNELTSMVLRVARDVSMIDPKINLRVTADTDLALLELAAELTRKGLGFPQYANDDVVIPALVAHGYELEDARDYTVAACWEFIIPGKGMEIVNVGAISFPAAVNQAIVAGLKAGDDMEGILARSKENISAQVTRIVETKRNIILPPAPYYSVLMTDCLESGRDLSCGARYNNFGIHGACSSNAADALAAVDTFVFVEKRVSPTDLVTALETDYADRDEIREMMDSGPKVGNDHDGADDMLTFLFDAFADACEAVPDNGRGGIVRPGTGSAMYYVWLARGHDGMSEPMVGATADGRHAGEFFSSSLAPSPGVRIRGPFSVLQSYAKLDYRRICNGGPITMELSDAVFRDKESIHKVALLIRAFAQLGCQELQLNTLNVETLHDAKKHPEKHRNLIVRVWGWSGYFCELAPEYQDHVIQRHMHTFS